MNTILLCLAALGARPLLADRRAVTALEYGLIAAAVVAIGLAGFSIIGEDLQGKFGSVQEALT